MKFLLAADAQRATGAARRTWPDGGLSGADNCRPDDRPGHGAGTDTESYCGTSALITSTSMTGIQP